MNREKNLSEIIEKLEKSRSEVIERLKKLYKRDYRYVVRDKDSSHLLCFSLKPKRYRDTESWGYVDPCDKKALTAYPIGNTDITEINYYNRSATSIKEFLEGEE